MFKVNFILKRRHFVNKCFSLLLAFLLLTSTIVVAFEAFAESSGKKLPIDFEDGNEGITKVTHVYLDNDGNLCYPDLDNMLTHITGDEALNGKGSLKITVPEEKENRRDDILVGNVSGNPDYKVSDLTLVTGVWLRLKVNEKENSNITEHLFYLRATQGTSGNNIFQRAVIYDKLGNRIGTTGWCERPDVWAFKIPAGFDGFVFLPFNALWNQNLWSTVLNKKSDAEAIAKFPDFSKDWNLSVGFGSVGNDKSWAGTNALIDDIGYFSSSAKWDWNTSSQTKSDFALMDNDVAKTLEKSGYNVNDGSGEVQQPSSYSLPITFDDGYKPVNKLDYVFGGQDHWQSENIGYTYSTKSPLIGEKSLEITEIPTKNTRTDTNLITMNGISDFKKDDFSKATGLLIRLKINNDTAAKAHSLAVILRQTGVSKATFLGKNAVFYDIKGQKIEVATSNLATTVPVGFDGYIFFPFKDAKSEQVTTPGSYDNYQTYPNSMVDLSKDYQMMFSFRDDTWGGTTVLLDDLRVYGGEDYTEILKKLYPDSSIVDPVKQPDRYSFPITFDENYQPFNKLDYVFNGQDHWQSENIGYTYSTKSPLIGEKSLEITEIPTKNTRTDTNFAPMSGIAEFKKDDFSKVTGILLRMKINNDTSKTSHTFRIALSQNGVSRITVLGKNAVLYDTKGKMLDTTSGQLNTSIPVGFDGYIFFPLEEARSEQVTVAGSYDRYETFPNSMVDLSKDYQMMFSFADKTWGGATVLLDDLRIYSGNEHIDILKKLYPDESFITPVKQPESYPFPITFDENYQPFNKLDYVYSSQEHWQNQEVGYTYYTKTPIIGEKSFEITEVPVANSRTDTNLAKMSGITDFKKNDFSNVTGLLMRVKINNDISESAHNFAIILRQSGISKGTILGNKAVLYDTKGRKLDTASTNLSVAIPVGFDGYIFFPFKEARSEQVTVPGSYDRYDSYPDSMVDLSKEYQMMLSLNDNTWGGTTVLFDDFRIYSGENHIEILKTLYPNSGIVSKDSYTLPLDLDGGDEPFLTSIIQNAGGLTESEKNGGGELEYKQTDLSSGKTLVFNFADNVVQKGNLLTTTANKFKIPDKAKGFLFRVRTNSKDGTSLSVNIDPNGKNIQVGRGAILYDTKGEMVMSPPAGGNWLSANLTENFNGFVFMPFSSAFSNTDWKYCNEMDWSFFDTLKDMRIGFYNVEVSTGTIFEIDYFGIYTTNDYLDEIEAAGYELDLSNTIEHTELLGDANEKFFYETKMNSNFNEETVDGLYKFTALNGNSLNSKAVYSKSNVQIGNGKLTLIYSSNGKTGAIRSNEMYSFGYYEANIKIPKLSGSRTVFGIESENDFKLGGTGFQIDIATLNNEYLLQSGYRFMKDGIPLSRNGVIEEFNSNLSSEKFYGGYHTYGLLYTFNYLRFYVDGVLVKTVENTFARGGVYITLSGEITEAITEPINDGNSEIVAEYIRYWSINPDEMSLYDNEEEPNLPDYSNSDSENVYDDPGSNQNYTSFTPDNVNSTDNDIGTIEPEIITRTKALTTRVRNKTAIGLIIAAAVLLAVAIAGGIAFGVTLKKTKKEGRVK